VAGWDELDHEMQSGRENRARHENQMVLAPAVCQSADHRPVQHKPEATSHIVNRQLNQDGVDLRLQQNYRKKKTLTREIYRFFSLLPIYDC
jgi:hypothetical protein